MTVVRRMKVPAAAEYMATSQASSKGLRTCSPNVRRRRQGSMTVDEIGQQRSGCHMRNDCPLGLSRADYFGNARSKAFEGAAARGCSEPVIRPPTADTDLPCRAPQ